MGSYFTPARQGSGSWADPTGLSGLGLLPTTPAGGIGGATTTPNHRQQHAISSLTKMTSGAAGTGGVPPLPPATPPASSTAAAAAAAGSVESASTAASREPAVNAAAAAAASGETGDADDPATEDLAVRVAVRARPLVAKERLERARECLSYPLDGKSVILGKNRLFQFDEVFDPTVEQSTIYADLVAPLVESCFNGEDRIGRGGWG